MQTQVANSLSIFPVTTVCSKISLLILSFSKFSRVNTFSTKINFLLNKGVLEFPSPNLKVKIPPRFGTLHLIRPYNGMEYLNMIC